MGACSSCLVRRPLRPSSSAECVSEITVVSDDAKRRHRNLDSAHKCSSGSALGGDRGSAAKSSIVLVARKTWWLGNPEPPGYARSGRFSTCSVCPKARGACLFAPAEKRNQCVSQVFPSLQILGHPSIPFGKSPVHEVCDIELARAAPFGVLPCLFPIMLCSIRPAFHFSPPHLPQAYISWEMRRPDEGVWAKARLNWARRAAIGLRGSPSAAGFAENGPRTLLRSVCGAVVVRLISDLPLGSRLKDGNLVRRGWHSVQREGRGGRPLCYTAQAQDRDLVRADWETRNFILR
jgi:hypothetical protein